ncbi:hypothetical protein HK098_008396, partial [Nowakowskiella sp. JEL0407]
FPSGHATPIVTGPSDPTGPTSKRHTTIIQSVIVNSNPTGVSGHVPTSIIKTVVVTGMPAPTGGPVTGHASPPPGTIKTVIVSAASVTGNPFPSVTRGSVPTGGSTTCPACIRPCNKLCKSGFTCTYSGPCTCTAKLICVRKLSVTVVPGVPAATGSTPTVHPSSPIAFSPVLATATSHPSPVVGTPI